MRIRHNEQGFTLVELMITLVLSLLITYGIAQVLISSNQSSSSSDGVSQAQETARFVMSSLGRQIRASGANSTTNNSIKTQAVMGCDIPALNAINACSAENNIGATEADITITPANAGNAGNKNLVALSGDRLALAWVPNTALTYPPALGEPIIPPFPAVTTDCTGATFNGFTTDSTIINVFWVSLDPQTVTPDPLTSRNSLFCQGYLFDTTTLTVMESGTPQVIANGVEALQILYGEATDPLPINGSRNVSRYVNANEVADWNDVYAVKMAIMTRSIGDVTNSISNKQYIMLDAGLYNFTDTVNRQVFNSTFSFSNFRDE
jgi:type IV pilus assembly protein PilW